MNGTRTADTVNDKEVWAELLRLRVRDAERCQVRDNGDDLNEFERERSVAGPDG